MRSRRSSPKSSSFGSDMGMSATYRRDVESGRLATSLRARLTPRRVALGSLAGMAVLGYLWVGGYLDQDTLRQITSDIDIAGQGRLQEVTEIKEPVYEYVVDEYGDHFLPDYPQHIPSFDPDIALLPEPETIYSSINLRTHFHLPQSNAYPDEKMGDIHNPPRNPTAETTKKPVPTDAYSQVWQGPEDWDRGGVKMPKVQARKFGGDRTLMKRRREAVRRGFAHAWQAYKDFAWGHDEVAPQSQVPTDPFNGWGASIIDTLDTLLIMGFSDDYNLCRPHVNQVNFDWVGGRDWRHGYTITADSIGVSEDIDLHRDNNVGLPVFETGIRYLGGLLGAYDLSGDGLLLDRAVDLAEILSRAFYTNSGLPAGRMDPASPDRFTLYSVSSAEVGSMSLELIRLSQVTGDRKWFDLAQRATEFLAENIAPKSEFEPMLPLYISPDASNSQISGTFAWGGLIDSYYEYLVKAFHLLRGSPVSSVYRDLYERSVDKSREVLFKRTKAVPGLDLLTIGKYALQHTIPEVEHLTCFAGAMLSLGAKLLDRDQDMDDAQDFTNTCYWLSAATATGIQPDVAEFFHEGEEHLMYENITLAGDKHHPHGATLDIDTEDAAGRVVRDRDANWHWKSDGLPVHAEHGGREDTEPQKYYSRLKGSPPGTRKTGARYLNRPETIESVYYMYRLTGDKKWQDRGWKMYVSWVKTATVPGGISSIQDVTRDPEHVVFGDNMESFTFAETFKYHYLLHADEDLLSLDDYVLNTEAHPFLTNPSLKPGSSKLWRGPPHRNDPDMVKDLGVRGQGTNVQKWTRSALLHMVREQFRPQNQKQMSGGRGMGGGGGDPNFRPKPPPGF